MSVTGLERYEETVLFYPYYENITGLKKNICFRFKVNKKKMATPQIKKSKIILHGKSLEKGYHIYFAVRLCEEHLDKGRNKLLNSLSNFSLVKAYYSQFQVDHCGCLCFACKLRNDCLQVLIKRGTNVEYLEYDLFDKFQEAEQPKPFFELSCEANQRWCDLVYRRGCTDNITW